MNHSIIVNGQSYFTAQVVDAYERKSYDMTIIFRDTDEAPQIIDYYYGEPNVDITKEYIQRYLAKEAIK